MIFVFTTKRQAQEWYENNCNKCSINETCPHVIDVRDALITLSMPTIAIEYIGYKVLNEYNAELLEECQSKAE